MADIEASIREYYAARAPEYDRVYEKPERQGDVRVLQQWLPALFAGARVLEVACGTGFWTQTIAPVASGVVALDAAPETLAIAKRRVRAGNVRFVVGDAYALPFAPGRFDAAFLGFWLSHVPKRRRREFLERLAKPLRPGARVVLLDNLYVEGSSHPIAAEDEEGNTFQERRLGDGSKHLVLKNFPTGEEQHALVGGLADNAVFTEFEYYWAFQYAIPNN